MIGLVKVDHKSDNKACSLYWPLDTSPLLYCITRRLSRRGAILWPDLTENFDIHGVLALLGIKYQIGLGFVLVLPGRKFQSLFVCLVK